ncbi:MAG: N-acetylmuramoyl-L-alanine amidase [Xanthobacteraceae bacterium]
MKLSIQNHLLFHDGKQAPYRATPNRSGLMNPDTIIDHDTASNPLDPSGDIGWLTMPVAQASAHVVIDWRGGITQLAPFNVQCWHAGASKYGNRQNFNAFSIGIEHDNPGYLRKIGEGVYSGVCVIDTNKNPEFKVARVATPEHGDHYWLAYSEQQIAASVALHAALKAAYPSINTVLGHYHICPGRKTDTNPLFPLSHMQAIVRGEAGELPRPVAATPEPKPIAAPAKPSFVADATVVADVLNLRGGPGIQFAIKGSIPYGTRIDVQEADRLTNWMRVVTPFGATGYVHGGFVRLD